jgi:oxygen-dependent protoporphyrinogen oxidase
LPDAAVIGAGFSGLACGHALARAGRDVLVLEAGPRAGGVAGTDRVGEFLFERGPNTIQAGSASFRTLCGELGIADELVPSDESAKLRYLFHRGGLVALPTGPGGLFSTPLLSKRAKLRLVSEPLRRSRWRADADPEPSFSAFLDERIGPEPTALLAGAFVRGVYAGDATRLGARSAFPKLWDLTCEHGGIVRGMRKRERPGPLPGPDVRSSRLLSFEGGLQRMVDALSEALGDRLATGARVEGLERGGASRWRVTAGGERIDTEDVVLAVGPAAAHALLASTGVSLPAVASEHLRTVERSSVTLVHLGFAPGRVPPTPPGFGFLVPPAETGPDAPRCLGTIFASNLFGGRAPRGGMAISMFYASREVDAAPSAEELAREDLARALGGAEVPAPERVHVVSWPDAIPQYTVGHAERMAALESALTNDLSGVHLAGNTSGGVGVEQVIARGRAIADRIAGRIPS